MKLAFSGEARYPEYEDGYALYRKRSKSGSYMDYKTYKKVIREYCKAIAERLRDEGYVQLPADIGALAAVSIERKPQFRGKKFIGYGKMDWEKGHFDGSNKAFGITFLPRMRKKNNLRCYGFVANRQLFKRVKAESERYQCKWRPLEFSDEMI